MVMMTIKDSRCAYDFAVKEVREAGSSFICGNDFVCAKVGSEDGKFKQEITWVQFFGGHKQATNLNQINEFCCAPSHPISRRGYV